MLFVGVGNGGQGLVLVVLVGLVVVVPPPVTHGSRRALGNTQTTYWALQNSEYIVIWTNKAKSVRWYSTQTDTDTHI